MSPAPILARLLAAGCDPCAEARVWLGRRRATQRAWDACPRGEWLLWASAQAGVHPPRDWVAREIVSHAFRHAGLVLVRAGMADTLTAWAAALAVATVETVDRLLREAQAAAWAAAPAAAGAAGVAGVAGAAEHARCADAVRLLYPSPPAPLLALLAGIEVPRG